MLNVAQILAEYGAQYRQGILNEGDLLGPLYDRTEWDDLFVVVNTDSTVLDQAAWTMSDARMQKYQKTFLPVGGMQFTPNTIRLTHLMQDTELTPAEIEGTAIDFLAAQGLSAFSAPILNIFLQSYVRKSQESFHRYDTYKGIDVPLTPGVATNAGETFNGVKKQIQLAKLTGAGIPKPMTLLAGNAVPTDPVLYVEYIHALYDAVPPEYKDLISMIACDQNKIKIYKEGIRLKYQTYWNQLGQNPKFNTSKSVPLVDRECTLKGTFDMTGTNHHWMTTPGNAVKAIKKGSNLMAWNADQMVGGRTIWASNDYWTMYGFRHWHLLFENGEA